MTHLGCILSHEKLQNRQQNSVHPFQHQELYSCLISLDYKLLTTNCNLLKLLPSALSVRLLSSTLHPHLTLRSSFNWLWASFCPVLLYCCYDDQHWWCKQGRLLPCSSSWIKYHFHSQSGRGMCTESQRTLKWFTLRALGTKHASMCLE